MLERLSIKELLEVGGMLISAFGAGYLVNKVLSSRRLAIWKDELEVWKRRYDDLRNLPDQLSRALADKQGSERSRDEVVAENAKLRADLEAALQGTGSSAPQVIDNLTARLAKYDALRDALTGPEDELWKLRGVTTPDNFAQRMAQSRLIAITVANLKVP